MLSDANEHGKLGMVSRLLHSRQFIGVLTQSSVAQSIKQAVDDFLKVATGRQARALDPRPCHVSVIQRMHDCERCFDGTHGRHFHNRWPRYAHNQTICVPSLPRAQAACLPCHVARARKMAVIGGSYIG